MNCANHQKTTEMLFMLMLMLVKKMGKLADSFKPMMLNAQFTGRDAGFILF